MWKQEYAIGCVRRFLDSNIRSCRHMGPLVLSEEEYKKFLKQNAKSPLYTLWRWANKLRLSEASVPLAHVSRNQERGTRQYDT